MSTTLACAATSMAASALERLKGLVGTWDVEGQDRYVEYYLGSDDTVVEDVRGERTMASFYHLDGDELMLTHYCGAGNQPRMKAIRYDENAGVLSFELLDVTNLSAPDAYHTRELQIRFLDEDRIELVFTGVEDGERAPSTLTLRRRAK